MFARQSEECAMFHSHRPARHDPLECCVFEYLRSLSMLPTFLRHEGILVTCDEAMFQRSVVVLRETRCEDETQDSDVCSVSTEVATENHGQVPTDQTFAW